MILNPAKRPVWTRYAVAVLSVAFAVALRAWLLGALGTRSPFLTFYPAVIFAALYGGLPAGLAATSLSTVTAAFLWMEPVRQFAISDPADWLTVTVFAASSIAISLVADALRRAQTRATEAELQVTLAQERYRAQEELRRYKLLAEHSRDIILCMRRDDGRILDANAAAAKAYGYTREELCSLSIHQLRASATQALTASQLAEADSSGILFETEHKRKDESTFPAEVSSQGADIGGIRTLISVIRDATERKRADEELRSQREWLRVILTSIGDAVIVTGGDGKVTFLNPAAAGLTGWSEQQALGQPVQEVFHIIDEQTRQPAEDITGRVLREGNVVSLANHTALVTRDGRAVPIEDSAAPIRDAAGSVSGVVVVFHEVTAKRRAQEALQAERERLSMALAASNSGIWEWDLRTNVNFWSEELWKIYGIEPNSCSPSYEAWRQVILPEDLDGAEKAVQEAARNGTELNVEFRVRSREGEPRWLMSRAKPVRDADGQIARYVGISLDITERKRAEDALRASEVQLRTLGDNLPEGAIYRYHIEANGDQRLGFISAGIERLTGISAAEFMADPTTVARSFVPEDVAVLMAATKLSLERLSRFEVEARHVHRVTGEIRWSLLRSSPSRCPDGSTVWDGIELDITERKRADEALRASEAALRESEARYRSLVDLAPEPLLVQQDRRIVYCNEAAARLYGGDSPAGLLGINMLERVHPDELPAVMQRIRSAEQGARLPVRETRHLRLDGSEVAVETTAGPVEWHGRPAMLVFVRDITDRKLAEARLLDSQKRESLGLLAGGVAHDFNNLLVGVIGNASLAREMFPPDHPVMELLDGVLKTGEQAAHLTRQMLAYSGKGRFVVEPLDLAAILPEISGLVRPSIPKKIALHLELGEDLPAIEADRGQIQQVFMNLALNAAEAIGSGEGSITVRTFALDVDGEYSRPHPRRDELEPGKYVCLEVRDTGCGMDETTRAKVFDPFFSTKFVGRGLGLAAVAGIVRGHKGTITVTSTPGQGSCFMVAFPATARKAGASQLGARGDAPKGTGTLLVVDDEAIVREMAKKGLERHGYQVLVADGGMAAIDLCKRHPGEIALAILDLSMPDMNGEETLPELRKFRPEIKVIVSSGFSEPESMRLFRGQQVSGFIQKPYTAQSLAERVKDCLT